MLNQPLVLPLAVLYLALEAFILLMALLDRGVPPVLVQCMRMVAWAGFIDGLYWLSTSRWGAGPAPPEELGEKSTLSKVLAPLALRAECIARCDGRTWARIVLRLLMICGVALVVTRFLVMGVIILLIFLALFGLMELRWVAIFILWLLFFTFNTHLHFTPLASLIVLAVPVLLVVIRPSGEDLSAASVAMSCAALGLLWEYQQFEHPLSPWAFALHILQTASNLQAMLPGLFLGSAICALDISPSPPAQE